MGSTRQGDANKKAKREMHQAVGKVIDEKKGENIGTKDAEAEVAADLNTAAQEDTRARSRQQREKGRRERGSLEPVETSVPHIRASTKCVTQITVVETDPGKQPEALRVMTERARFMARQPGFVSISVHRSLDGRRIINYIQWETREQLQSAHKSPEFRKEWRHFDDLTYDIDPHLYELTEVMRAVAR
jgi:heme-degrading monooxygenase HmoA